MHGHDALAWMVDRTGATDGLLPGPGWRSGWQDRWRRLGASVVLGLGSLVLLASRPVAAQSTSEAFCATPLVETLGNLLQVIQMGGPLLGGIVALGATVTMPMVRRTDVKRELKNARNQGIIWGVIVAPLATTIISFLLQHVVVGAASCGF